MYNARPICMSLLIIMIICSINDTMSMSKNSQCTAKHFRNNVLCIILKFLNKPKSYLALPFKNEVDIQYTYMPSLTILFEGN